MNMNRAEKIDHDPGRMLAILDDVMAQRSALHHSLLENQAVMLAALSALNGKYEGAQPGKAAIASEIVAFAKAEGFAFTAEELAAYEETDVKELSEEQLTTVAGGAFNKNDCFCAMGGGGKDPETGHTCACVMFGYGNADTTGHYLVCTAAGWIKKQ